MFDSKEIGSSLVSLKMIFEALRFELFRFKFHWTRVMSHGPKYQVFLKVITWRSLFRSLFWTLNPAAYSILTLKKLFEIISSWIIFIKSWNINVTWNWRFGLLSKAFSLFRTFVKSPRQFLCAKWKVLSQAGPRVHQTPDSRCSDFSPCSEI